MRGQSLRLIWDLVSTVSFDYGIITEGNIFQMVLGNGFRAWSDKHSLEMTRS